MRIHKISQNIEYLQSIGVPKANRQKLLDYLMSLTSDARKNILRKIRKKPSINLEDMKKLVSDAKKK